MIDSFWRDNYIYSFGGTITVWRDNYSFRGTITVWRDNYSFRGTITVWRDNYSFRGTIAVWRDNYSFRGTITVLEGHKPSHTEGQLASFKRENKPNHKYLEDFLLVA